MRYNISRVLGAMVGIPVAIIAWMVSIFGFDLSFIIDGVIGLGGFVLSYFPTQRLTSRKYLNEIGLIYLAIGKLRLAHNEANILQLLGSSFYDSLNSLIQFNVTEKDSSKEMNNQIFEDLLEGYKSDLVPDLLQHP